VRDGETFTLTAGPDGLVREYRSRYVILATGNMNHPRRLDVPGEDLPHVSHSFAGVHRYFRRRLLVVGGRNSAVEAAIRCWRAGADVTISYRGARLEKKKLNSRYHLEISILTD
jgi:thioredoxin reductase (NADPH)